MSNVYKNAFYLPTTTANTTVYTCNATARAIIQNIQITNSTTTGNTVKAYIFSSTAGTTYTISYASITGPTICNLAAGPIVLQENDAILLSASSTSNVSGTLAILEVNRSAVSK
jgi:hypothetical protein